MTQGRQLPVRRFFRCLALLAFAQVFGFAGGVYAQNTIPSGTIIPIFLPHTIDSQKSKPGQAIVAKVAQDVPLEKQVVHRNTKVLGKISQIEHSAGRTTLVLQFDRIQLGKAQVPITTQLRALADAASVEQAQTPTDSINMWSSSPWARNTVQIGGDAVYRGGGPVQSLTGEIVGAPTGCIQCGVLDRVPAAPGPQCAGSVADDTEPQAMWVFSADACGIYGFSNLQFQNGSTVSRDGQILFSAHRPIKLSSGTALLLTVAGTQAGAEK